MIINLTLIATKLFIVQSFMLQFKISSKICDNCNGLIIMSCAIPALDAYVLLELYDYLMAQARVQAPDLNLEPMISMKWLKPSKNERKRARQRGDQKHKTTKKLVCAGIIIYWDC